jgi:hypothetical protein
MSRYPTVSDYPKTLDGVSESVRAVKGLVEIIAGLRQGEALGAPQIFMQSTIPTPPRGFLMPADLWINTTDDTLNYWNGKQWRKLS